jgi:hypothetical protein
MRRLLVAIAAAVLSACGMYDPFNYDAAYYDPSYSAFEATYVYGVFEPSGVYYDSERSPQAVDLEAAAAVIAAQAGDWFTRSDCVKATASRASVKLELDDCDGRFGGRNVDGIVGIALSLEDDQLRFSVRSSNLTMHEDPFILDVQVVATSSGPRRALTLDSRTRSTDHVDSRASLGTITWDQGSPCVSIDTQGTGTRDEVSVSSTLAGYQRCADRCPSAGSVTVRGGEGTFVASFDGDDTLRVFAPNGGDRTYGLQCE